MSKKNYKAVGVIVSLLFAACLFVGCASSSGGPTIEIKRVDVVRDLISVEDMGLVTLETTNGEVIYDLDLTRSAVKTGDVATDIEDGDIGLTYILENGYPYKSLVNNKEIDAYITQMAVWWYTSEDKISKDIKNPPEGADEYHLSEIVKDLVDKARSAVEVESGKTAKIFGFDDTKKARVVGLF